MLEKKNSLDSIEFIEWIYKEYIFLYIFLAYHIKFKDSPDPTINRWTFIEIIKWLRDNYKLKTSKKEILLSFCGEQLPENLADEILVVERENLFFNLEQKNIYQKIINKYKTKLLEFFNSLISWKETNLYQSFDEAFDWEKDNFIPNYKQLWLENDKEIYRDISAKTKMILRKMRYEHYKKPPKTSPTVILPTQRQKKTKPFPEWRTSTWHDNYDIAWTWWDEEI